MVIRKQTIDALKAQGIDIRWYPEKSYEDFFQRIWKKQYDFSYNYNKANVRGSKETEEGRTNVLFESFAELEKNSRRFADQTVERHCSPYEFDTLFVEYDGKIFCKKENVKSKEITEDYVLKLVGKNKKLYDGAFGAFTMQMQKICEKLGYGNYFCVYPTTYGIGIWLFWNWKVEEQANNVENILKSAGIEYYNEYSEHRWVYRFKISKKRENLQKIFNVAA